MSPQPQAEMDKALTPRPPSPVSPGVQDGWSPSMMEHNGSAESTPRNVETSEDDSVVVLSNVSDSDVQLLSPSGPDPEPSDPEIRRKILATKKDEGRVFLMADNKKLLKYGNKIIADIVNNLHHKVKLKKHPGRAVASSEEMDAFMIKMELKRIMYVVSLKPVHRTTGCVDVFILNGLSDVHEHADIPWTMGFKMIEIVSAGVKNPLPYDGDLPVHEKVLLQYLKIKTYQPRGEVMRILIKEIDIKKADAVEPYSSSNDEEASTNSIEKDEGQLQLGSNFSSNQSGAASGGTDDKTEKNDETETLNKDDRESVKIIADVKCDNNSTVAELDKPLTKESDTEDEDGEITSSSSSCENISSGEDLGKYDSDPRPSRSRSHKKGRREPKSTKVTLPHLQRLRGATSNSESDSEEHATKLKNRLQRFKSPPAPRNKDQRPRKRSPGHKHHRSREREREDRKSGPEKSTRRHWRRRRHDSSSSTSTLESQSPRLGRYDFNKK